MSLNTVESTSSNEMIAVIKGFLRNLNVLSVIQEEGSSGFFYVKNLYEAAYEFARHTHLYPDFRKFLTDEDKNILKEHFTNAFVKLVGYTPGLVNNIGPSTLNVARTRRSQIWFIKNEVLDLYKEVNGNDLPKEMKDLLSKLNESNNVLECRISNWTRPDYDEADDDPEDVPNLNGVPESHCWWTKEHRQMSKNRKN